MVNLKTLVLGAGLGLVGLVPRVAEGEEYTINDFTRVNGSNFQTEVIDASYEKPVVVLFDSSCPSGEDALNRGQEVQEVLFDIMNIHYQNTKFSRFDRCGLGINESNYINFEKKYGDGTAALATVIYYKGNVFFKLVGSLSKKDPSSHEKWVTGISKRLTALTQE